MYSATNKTEMHNGNPFLVLRCSCTSTFVCGLFSTNNCSLASLRINSVQLNTTIFPLITGALSFRSDSREGCGTMILSVDDDMRVRKCRSFHLKIWKSRVENSRWNSSTVLEMKMLYEASSLRSKFIWRAEIVVTIYFDRTELWLKRLINRWRAWPGLGYFDAIIFVIG